MKLICLVLVLLSSLINIKCYSNDDNLIKLLTQEKSIEPSFYENLVLFVNCNSDDYSIMKKKVTYQNLKLIYKEYYANMDFKDFLCEAFNGENLNITTDCFILDPQITTEYNSVDLNTFLLSYCRKKSDNDSFYLIDEISENEENTILYYLFINSYYAFFDDYIGHYSIRKIPL